MGKEILLIEDNEAHAILIKRCFKKNKIDVNIKHLSDGEEALVFLIKNPQNINYIKKLSFIILDLRLPKVDGLTVLKNIKESNELKKIPVIILSTSEAENDINQAYELYANSYLTKPVDYDKFSELIKRLGEYWLNWNRL